MYKIFKLLIKLITTFTKYNKLKLCLGMNAENNTTN